MAPNGTPGRNITEQGVSIRSAMGTDLDIALGTTMGNSALGIQIGMAMRIGLDQRGPESGER